MAREVSSRYTRKQAVSSAGHEKRTSYSRDLSQEKGADRRTLMRLLNMESDTVRMSAPILDSNLPVAGRICAA